MTITILFGRGADDSAAPSLSAFLDYVCIRAAKAEYCAGGRFPELHPWDWTN
jgi:hypothetical protein